MARNASGTHSLPTGNPVVSGSTISSVDFNSTMDDLSAELTDSLSRSGKGGMTSPLRCADGSVSAPAFSFTSDTDCGMYRVGANSLGIAVGGAQIIGLTSTGAALNSKKITGLANGTASTDGVAYGQISTRTTLTITAGTDWAITSTYGYKFLNVVHLNITATATVGSAAWTSVMTLPTGSRPANDLTFLGYVNDNTTAYYTAVVKIATTGVVSVERYDNATSLVAISGITLATGDQLLGNVTFTVA